MSKRKVRTTPDLSFNSSKHQEALINDKDFRAWQFNVADHLKNKTVEEIRQHLKATAHPFAVCMENWNSDFNCGTLVRNANAFNAQAVYYLGDKKIDRRGMVGCHNYTDVKFLETVDDLTALQTEYQFVGVDNVGGALPVSSYSYPENPLLIFGSEGTGLTPTLQSMCQDIICIEQYGSVRSFNAAVASGIVLYDFVHKLNRKKQL